MKAPFSVFQWNIATAQIPRLIQRVRLKKKDFPLRAASFPIGLSAHHISGKEKLD
jgi:hypothetical protein